MFYVDNYYQFLCIKYPYKNIFFHYFLTFIHKNDKCNGFYIYKLPIIIDLQEAFKIVQHYIIFFMNNACLTKLLEDRVINHELMLNINITV